MHGACPRRVFSLVCAALTVLVVGCATDSGGDSGGDTSPGADIGVLPPEGDAAIDGTGPSPDRAQCRIAADCAYLALEAGPCHTPDCGPDGRCRYLAHADGAWCDDRDACTIDDRCDRGACIGTPLDCDDGDPCTTTSCDVGAGCRATVLVGAPCDDGDACTPTATCDADGVCVGQGAVTCDDGDPCTDDACDPVNGCVAWPDDNPCDDGNPCTVGDRCGEGGCLPGENVCECTSDADCPTDANLCRGPLYCDVDGSVGPAGTCQVTPSPAVICDDGTRCTVDYCDPAEGCRYVPLAGAVCDDGDACTADDRCADDGTCRGMAPTDCDDGEACTLDACERGLGCTTTPLPGPCDDGDACTVGDACALGVCVGGAPRTCNDHNPCTRDVCDPALGCVHTPNFASCDDGDACTMGESCREGACVGGADPHCDDGNPCTDDACDPARGCVYEPNEGPCEDGDACTVGDRCVGGLCAPGTGRDCDDDNPCTLDGCRPIAGCFVLPLPGLGCDDGDACTIGDACDAAGHCVPKAERVCADSDPCTAEACDPVVGCVITPTAAPCDDGNPCTTGDHCVAGACVPGTNVCGCTGDEDCPPDDDRCDGARFCDLDGRLGAPGRCQEDPATAIVCDTSQDTPCRRTTCAPETGECRSVVLPNGAACDDGTACTLGDACSDGACVGGPVVCMDGNPCTDDVCDATAGCRFPPNTASCDDQDACTAGDACVGGACVGTPVSCDDGRACTLDVCEAGPGCRHIALSGSRCEDGDPCTVGDTCAGDGSCTPGASRDCGDGDACNGQETCDPSSGACRPGAPVVCTGGDICAGLEVCDPLTGDCVPGRGLDCADPFPCTIDGCDPATGCSHDHSPCGSEDECANGLDDDADGRIDCGDDDCDDGWEDNDRRTSASAITAPAFVEAQVCANDADWFAVPFTAGCAVVIDLRFANADGDLELQAFDPSGRQVAAGYSDDDDESVAFTVSTGGDHTIHVYGFWAAANAYTLTVTQTCP